MSTQEAPAFYPTPLPSRIERAARAIYGVAQRHWIWRTAHEQGCAVCTSPGFDGWEIGFAEPRHADGTCPVSHYLRFHLLAVSVQYPRARVRRWRAIKQRAWALWNEDQPPIESWSPLSDDTHAWVLDTTEEGD